MSIRIDTMLHPNLTLHDEIMDENTVYLLPLDNSGFAVVFSGTIAIAESHTKAVELAENVINTTDADDALIIHADGTIEQAYDPDEGLQLRPEFIAYLEAYEQAHK